MDTPPPFQKLQSVRLPHPGLRPFIAQYVFERMNVPQGCTVKKFLPLCSTCSIAFFVGDHFEILDLKTRTSEARVSFRIQGPRTQISHYLRIRSDFISFTIKFTPTGFYRLLGITTGMHANHVIAANELPHLPVENISTQLSNTTDIKQYLNIIEPYLLLIISKSRDVPTAIEKAATELEHQYQPSIKGLAVEAFTSLRQLERNFVRYIGLTPKTYFRTNRFLKLLAAKKNDPEQKWGSLAHEFGFYDQMHLVKEFKYFLKSTPSTFDLSELSF